MAVITKPVRIPNKLNVDRVLLGLLTSIIDRIERARVEEVDDLNQTISASPTQAEVQAISDKVDELLAAFRTANILDE